MGGCAKYFSLCGMFTSSTNITYFFSAGGPYTPFLRFSVFESIKSYNDPQFVILSQFSWKNHQMEGFSLFVCVCVCVCLCVYTGLEGNALPFVCVFVDTAISNLHKIVAYLMVVE